MPERILPCSLWPKWLSTRVICCEAGSLSLQLAPVWRIYGYSDPQYWRDWDFSRLRLCNLILLCQYCTRRGSQNFWVHASYWRANNNDQPQPQAGCPSSLIQANPVTHHIPTPSFKTKPQKNNNKFNSTHLILDNYWSSWLDNGRKLTIVLLQKRRFSVDFSFNGHDP